MPTYDHYTRLLTERKMYFRVEYVHKHTAMRGGVTPAELNAGGLDIASHHGTREQPRFFAFLVDRVILGMKASSLSSARGFFPDVYGCS